MSMSPKRILHVFSRMDRGGAETRIMDVYRHIDRSLVQFDFLVMEPGQHHYDTEIEELGGRKFKVRHPRDGGTLLHLFDLVRLFKRKGPFQAIHAHTAHHEGIVALAARLAGLGRVICHARTTGSSYSSSKLKRAAIWFGRQLILIFATRLLAISKEAGRYLFGERAVKQQKVEVVPNAIDLSSYEQLSEPNKESLRQELLIPPCQLLIGHVGRFNPVKNHSFLILLLHHLRSQGVDARLVLIGGGGLQAQIKQQAAGSSIDSFVHFLGVRQDIPKLLQMFDVFVMPSLYEGLGGAAIEAQAAGIPCVVASSLPESVDMGLGLVQFLSLDLPMEEWADYACRQAERARPTYDCIREAFRQKGFLLECELDSLQRAYELPLTKEQQTAQWRLNEA